MPKKRKITLSPDWRERIKIGVILDRLHKHTLGELEMLPTQIQAAKLLLSKVMPDLRAIEHSGQIDTRDATELTRDELMRIAASGSTRATETGKRTSKPKSVH